MSECSNRFLWPGQECKSLANGSSSWKLDADIYEPFDVVTKRSLQHAAAEMEQTIDERTADDLVDSYNGIFPYAPQFVILQSNFTELDLDRFRFRFEDSVPALQALIEIPNVEIAVFSNGALKLN